jgi:hypothetical protein
MHALIPRADSAFGLGSVTATIPNDGDDAHRNVEEPNVHN